MILNMHNSIACHDQSVSRIAKTEMLRFLALFRPGNQTLILRPMPPRHATQTSVAAIGKSQRNFICRSVAFFLAGPALKQANLSYL